MKMISLKIIIIVAKTHMSVPLVQTFLPPLHEAKKDWKFEKEEKKCRRGRREVNGNAGTLMGSWGSLLSRGQNRGKERWSDEGYLIYPILLCQS